MVASEQIEELICQLATWDRPMLTHQFLNFRSSFPVDVTEEFLTNLSEDRLRHVFLAMYLQSGKCKM